MEHKWLVVLLFAVLAIGGIYGIVMSFRDKIDFATLPYSHQPAQDDLRYLNGETQ